MVMQDLLMQGLALIAHCGVKITLQVTEGKLHASNLSRNVSKSRDSSTSLAIRNATVAVAKWGVTRQIFLATCNATNVALQVARTIASCNMAFNLE